MHTPKHYHCFIFRWNCIEIKIVYFCFFLLLTLPNNIVRLDNCESVCPQQFLESRIFQDAHNIGDVVFCVLCRHGVPSLYSGSFPGLGED